jgi:hypothetical protein
MGSKTVADEGEFPWHGNRRTEGSRRAAECIGKSNCKQTDGSWRLAKGGGYHACCRTGNADASPVLVLRAGLGDRFSIWHGMFSVAERATLVSYAQCSA